MRRDQAMAALYAARGLLALPFMVAGVVLDRLGRRIAGMHTVAGYRIVRVPLIGFAVTVAGDGASTWRATNRRLGTRCCTG